MKKPLLLSSLFLGGLALTLAATPALAQPETAPPPPAPASAPFGGVGAGLGVGAVAWLAGPVGAQVVYDLALFHIEGVLGYGHSSPANNGPSSSDFEFGAAGWYHLFRGVNSDFSIGGGAGLIYDSPPGGASSTRFALEPGAEARVFLTPNVALEGRVGLAFTFGDNNAPTTFGILGQTTAGFGFTYFFR